MKRKAAPKTSVTIMGGVKKLRYKRIHGGIFYFQGQKITKNQVFLAYPDEIPKTFRGSFKCLDEEQKASSDVGIKLSLKSAGKNKWNIVNILTGDTLNEKPLSAADAKRFLEDGEDLPEEDTPEPLKEESISDEEEYDD